MTYLQYKIPSLPNHTELYRDLHLIIKPIVSEIFKQCGWIFSKQGWFREYTTEFTHEIEHNNWDIAIKITNSPEEEFRKPLRKSDYVQLLIEYKSSFGEWHKQLDQHIRPIKTRMKYSVGTPILLTFDKQFIEYDQALSSAGIKLIVLPTNLLNPQKKT